MAIIDTHIDNTIETLVDQGNQTYELNAAYLNGRTYDDITQLVAGGIRYIGTCEGILDPNELDPDTGTTFLQPIYDGCEILSIRLTTYVNGKAESKDVTAVSGDMVTYEDKEFVVVPFNKEEKVAYYWIQFGSADGKAVAGYETSKETTGISAALASDLTLQNTSHSHSITDNGHTHTYDKATSASFTGSAVTSKSATTGIKVAFTKTPGATDAGHTHTIAHSHTASLDSNGVTITDGGHTHSVNLGGIKTDIGSTSTATGSGKANLTATYSGNASFKGTAASHSHNYEKSSLSYDSTNHSMSIVYATTASTSASITPSGSISLPSVSVTDSGHTHSYDKTTSVVTTAGQSTTTGSSTTGISAAVTNTTVTVSSITAATLSGSSSANISLNNMELTVTDPGHTHSVTPSGSVALSYTSTASGKSATGISVNSGSLASDASAKAVTINITDNGHTHTQQ